MRSLAIILLASCLCGATFVPDEPHALKGTERELGLHVLRSHYEGLLAAYSPLRLSGVGWTDPKKPASCEIRVRFDASEFPAGTLVDGLPHRRAQPDVFVSFQQQLVAEMSRCGAIPGGMAFTADTWRQLDDAARATLIAGSATTFCRKDSDCEGVELADPCGARAPLRLVGSGSADIFFFGARKFFPPLLKSAEQMVNGARGQLGDAHPDGGFPAGPRSCPMGDWKEKPLRASCVARSCRLAQPAPR